MNKIDYQALREAAEAIKVVATPQKLLAFRMKVTPQVVLALLDERERNQQYIKRRDQENEDIALTVGRLLIENGQLVADTLRHLADNEIDSDYFAITSTNENGTEIDHEMAITDYALQAAGTVDELVAALESAEKRIAELKAEPVSQTYKLNQLSGNSPVTPDGWVIVPKKLTAENGAKGVLSGEFSETTFISCPECFGDDDCDTCDGSGRIEIKVPVTWTTIKSIWDKGIAHFAAKPPQEVNRG
ncbi:ead/Ea22-like family protein [Escherichia coli]|uniref:ead/Ea22-like family protein n=1 Tax=Escherichia coli TaxID=562 RepID=UPI000CDA7168|nr:ead/Ea22-like family protein [Escherichia coli]MCE7683017.1 ead/Ea22-like family protein [Escherichia coli]